MSWSENLQHQAGGEERLHGVQEAERIELDRRRAAAELAAAERRAAQSALAEEEAAARERLQRLDDHIESLLSRDPQEFVIRFLQTGGQ
jgi:prephenate dehydratase